MKKITALILALTMIFSMFSLNADAIDIHDAALSGYSEKANGIPVDNDFVLYFKKIFRTVLNEFLMKSGVDFVVMVTDLSLDEEKIAIEVGKKAKLVAKTDPKEAVNKKVNWYSDNPDVATVEDGTVKGRKEGTATVYAIADDGNFYDKCVVTVKPATNSAKFTVSFIDYKGNQISKVTYSTSSVSAVNVNKPTTLNDGEGEFLGWICDNDGNVYQNGSKLNIKDFVIYDDNGIAKSFDIILRESVRYGISGNDPAVTLFGGNGNDVYRSIEPSGDGGYFSCGTTTSTSGVFNGRFESDWLLPYSFVSKIGADGKTEWIKTFGSAQAGIYINDIAVLSDGNIIAVGYQSIDDINEIKEKGTSEALIYKLSGKDGSVISQKIMGGKESDIFNTVAKTTKGFAVGGKTNSTQGDFEGYAGNSAILFHFDSEFNILWSKALSGSKGGSVDGLSADNSGNIFVSVTTSSIDKDFASFSGLTGGYTDTVILKYNYLGIKQWHYVIASSGRDEFRAIQADNSGGCVVGGQYELFTSLKPDGTLSGFNNLGGVDAILFGINSYGAVNWTKALSGYGNDYITDIAKGTKGYVIAGYTTSSNREFASIGNVGKYDGFVCCVNSSGTTLSMKSQAGTDEDTASCVACIGSNYIVAGKTKSKNGSFAEYYGSSYMGYTAKYSLN